MKQEEQFDTFLFEYFHEGSWWGLTIQATSKEDAIARMNKLPHAKFVGSNVTAIPGSLGFVAKFLCWWRNLIAAH